MIHQKKDTVLVFRIFSVGLRQKPEMKIGKTACVPRREQTPTNYFSSRFNFCRI
ncbi:hypothetical protein [Capnocytophaga cynodegmi]|uniref:hypothetical protein n=1 Tax=Capnocytophaga cynodegmi TaxID=28189 RepID=UPI001BB40517|nr:hypothetical protein [Capnocytophaga cynodegmi]